MGIGAARWVLSIVPGHLVDEPARAAANQAHGSRARAGETGVAGVHACRRAASLQRERASGPRKILLQALRRENADNSLLFAKDDGAEGLAFQQMCARARLQEIVHRYFAAGYHQQGKS